MKSRRRASIQIFLFQLLLFWWAYCSLFPWHPAAILQLLVFTSIKEGGCPLLLFHLHFQPRSFWQDKADRETPDITAALRSKSPVCAANEQPRDYSVNSKSKNLEALSASCVIPGFSCWLKTKTSATAQWSSSHWLIDPRWSHAKHQWKAMGTYNT